MWLLPAPSLDEAVDFLCFPQKPCTPMLNFFARSGLEIEKIDSLWTGRGILHGREVSKEAIARGYQAGASGWQILHARMPAR